MDPVVHDDQHATPSRLRIHGNADSVKQVQWPVCTYGGGRPHRSDHDHGLIAFSFRSSTIGENSLNSDGRQAYDRFKNHAQEKKADYISYIALM
jgi:hypothetical protein